VKQDDVSSKSKKNKVLLYSVLGSVIILIGISIGIYFKANNKIKVYKGYETVKIGTQTWMTENLNVDKFRNGDSIPEAKSAEEWTKAGSEGKPAWCYYGNNPENSEKYGKLYNWYAVNDPRGLAPEGFHVSSNEEWTILNDFLGGDDIGGKKLKSKYGWNENGNGTNEVNFSAQPGGYRDETGYFDRESLNGYWWCSTFHHNEFAVNRNLYHLIANLNSGEYLKEGGMSVRCLKD
jgi:uncharacterized protein (TIGR02145 family)